MITYDFYCSNCMHLFERAVKLDDRDDQRCDVCGILAVRQMSAPRIKIAGKPVSGGGPNKFTADALRIPLKDLPRGLKV
jgi:putative FmdB family regulatory protein